MGLLSKLRKLFNKNIECGDEADGHLIYLYPSSNRVVNVGASIVVDDNHYAVFVCNDRVTDVLPPGKHKITAAALPTTFAKLKLDKPNKAGNYPKKFKADIYYFYKELMVQQKFCSYDKFFLKSEKFGKVKGFTEGLFDIQILDSERLMKILLIDRYYVPNKKGLEIISGLVGNEVNRIIEDLKVDFSEIILNPKMLVERLNPLINERCESLGIKVVNLEVTSFKLSKKVQRIVAQFVSERKQTEEQFLQTGIKYEPEQIVPDKVDISQNSQNNNSQMNYNNYNQANQQQNGPQIIRRGGGFSMNQSSAQNPNYNSQINSNEIFNGENKKVCKFCGQTIDVGYSFCPRCGFKQ